MRSQTAACVGKVGFACWTWFAVGTLATLAATGCATTMSAGSHVRPGVQMARYQTYDWGPADALPTGDPRLDRDGFFQDHLEGAVEKRLSTKGLMRATAKPDLLLHYHASIDTRVDIGPTERKYSTCRVSDCRSWVVEYEAGTLVLDVVDARTNQLIWRGWAQDGVAPMLDKREVMAQKIDEAVTRMMAAFPRP